jgi:lysophospholipase L1-like esterase
LKTERAIVLLAIAALSACRTAPASNAPAVPAKPPHLTATKFVAYGDSITEGFVQRCPSNEPTEKEPTDKEPTDKEPTDKEAAPPTPRLGFFLEQGRAQPSPTAYPGKLQELLDARYPSQMITVVNEGEGGEDIEGGVANLPRVLTANAPQVLLLQEGINTLNQKHKEGIPLVVDGLRTMIQEARSRSIVVFAGTLLPERPGGCRAYDYNQDFDDIIEANVQIRRMIGTEGAVLVDLYEAFNGHTALLIGEDGLHPSAVGYQRIAETFFDAIKTTLED